MKPIGTKEQWDETIAEHQEAIDHVDPSRIVAYDPWGRPMTWSEWSAVWASERRLVARTYVHTDGRMVSPGDPDELGSPTQPNSGWVCVSTVWIGLVGGYMTSDRMPRTMETMVFGVESNCEPCWRYATLEEARKHHQQVVDTLVHGVVPGDLSAE